MTRSQKAVERVFTDINRKFFRGWNRKKTWKILYFDAHNIRQLEKKYDIMLEGYDGRCQKRTKTIFVHSADRVLVIHEICHAACPRLPIGHFEKWQQKMKRAAQKAMQANDPDLASEITRDLDEATVACQEEDTNPYALIRDYAGEDQPSFMEVIDIVRDYFFADLSRSDFIYHYKDSLKYYNQCMRRARDQEKYRLEFERMKAQKDQKHHK